MKRIDRKKSLNGNKLLKIAKTLRTKNKAVEREKNDRFTKTINEWLKHMRKDRMHLKSTQIGPRLLGPFVYISLKLRRFWNKTWWNWKQKPMESDLLQLNKKNVKMITKFLESWSLKLSWACFVKRVCYLDESEMKWSRVKETPILLSIHFWECIKKVEYERLARWINAIFDLLLWIIAISQWKSDWCRENKMVME